MDASSFFRGKNITLMRVGLLGRGVKDAAYLAQCGATVLVVDDAPQAVMQPSVDALQKYPNISFKFGSYDLHDFRTCDMVLKGAGVALNSPEIAEAKKNGIPVRMSADLFMELAGIPVIGVTGTRGKSTVTHMLEAILKAAGKKVLLGGNVRGISTLALLPETTPEHVAVLELDSWQCQGLGEAALSPHIAVFTTFYPDHLNYYKDDPGQYLADKSNIFLYQDPDDTLVTGSQCAPTLIEAYGEHIISHMMIADDKKLPTDWTLTVPGAHNRYNAGIALVAARAMGIGDETSRRPLAAFAGVPGRLELVAEKGDIRYYNDTTATTPEATLAALAALGADHTVLIMGGADKGLDMSKLLAKLPEVKKVVLLAGTGTDRVHSELPDAPMHDSLENALADARAHAAPGDAILLSPAFASFGMFKNEFDRGDQFTALAKGYGE
ncbi:MAG: UDP-N-acetylmuramoyl-L-alanine--D-glutamate ligase [Parcubacteria group bacterium 21-54-25]|nr:MAG: UDP-N-acetylmuramoyl-L-alanine--D-glutamate ligase [Parcubacteria group bacterium 21-54-25]HQU07472.1 UDP-N-acetylmuramoyl-L-alanine--D-glutamate ligase [Candidatus Paceibacterota bacterium]